MIIFFSYSHHDKGLAGEFKRILEHDYGFAVFLAHEDIEPASEWQEEIIAQLYSCHVFIALITPHFYLSDWTDQETGFALARKIKIIPINFGDIPKGFINKYQALPLTSTEEACSEIIPLLFRDPSLRELVLNSLIKTFSDSYSFKRADSTFSRLKAYDDYLSSQQKNEIIRISGLNNQIFDSFAARKKILEFIDKHEFELDSELIEIFKSKFQ